ncbi:MAG: histidine--tRNA ligase [Aphanocapsa feldmannii 288cV]|nr:MAG: histidine--tRNA ligase [Aphanocapsa feldmannii 288cV]
MEKLRSLRGMADLLPEATRRWQHIEATALAHFQRAGLAEIRTPLLEATALFARGIGEATDVVGKEMYSFLDRGERSCTLRPEGTASVVRAAIQHGLLAQGSQRLWYGGPMFRYERPQAGRLRQFHQLGVEYLGYTDPFTDAEAIAVAWDLLGALGISGLELELNSLGTSADRARYRKILMAWLGERRGGLDEDSRTRLATNPLRILDSKDPGTRALLRDAPSLADALSEESCQRFAAVRQALTALDIPFRLEAGLVRGLDYYNHTAFEITSNQLGAQATVCGGGRYDGLVEQLGGPATACVGWAMGMERLVLLLTRQEEERKAVAPHLDGAPRCYLVSRPGRAALQALALSRSLRARGLAVERDVSGSTLAKQFRRADRSGATWVITIGEAEAEACTARLRHLRRDGVEREFAQGQLPDQLLALVRD